MSLEDLVESLPEEDVRRLLVAAAETHEDVARAVRLAAADDGERLAVLRAAVDDRLRLRRHLDYWGSSRWAEDAAPVVSALAAQVAAGPSPELVLLLQRAAGHLVKAIMRADDSDGLIGGLARDVLDLHLACCGAGVADPDALARWMVRFSFEEQDFFELDPVDYAPALGETGLAVYRREVAARSGPGEIRAPALHDPYAGYPSHAARYAAERLAVLDRDVDRLIALLGEDLSAPHQFIRVVEAMVELGRWDDALAWARRGIAETTGRQVAKLYDLAAGLLTERDDPNARRAPPPMHSSRTPPGAPAPGGTRSTPPARCWPSAIRPAWSRRCSPTARRRRPGPSRPAGTMSCCLRPSGCGSPRPASRSFPGTRWRSTCALGMRCSNAPTNGPTARRSAI
ncbi:MAG: hypothetical protein MUE51_14930 [Thermoleophilia bacterium]|nr:hypothetical protein [Thermoleophilia bacterium]